MQDVEFYRLDEVLVETRLLRAAGILILAQTAQGDHGPLTPGGLLAEAPAEKTTVPAPVTLAPVLKRKLPS